MICESCNKYEATVSYTHVVENKKTTVNLCGFCASKEDDAVDAGESAEVPGAKIVIELTNTGQGDAGGAGAGSSCSECGLTYADFKKVGRFGCPGCYSAFARQLERLLKRIHGACQHRGKGRIEVRKEVSREAKATCEAEGSREPEVSQLRAQLEAAVAEEAFECAAELRDRILKLEQAARSE